MIRTLFLFSIVSAALAVSSVDASSLIRNGSFEAGNKYWLTFGADRIKSDGAPHGRYYYSSPQKGAYFRSASFALGLKKNIVVSCWARQQAGAKKTRLHLDLLPSNRPAGNGRYRSFWGKHGWRLPTTLGPEWKRISWRVSTPDETFKWRNGMWDKKSWIIMLNGHGVDIDGVSVTLGKSVPKTYVSHKPIEVGVACTNFPGYRTTSNVLHASFKPELKATVFNPGTTARTLTLRWEQLDYMGKRRFSSRDQAITLKAGETKHLTHTMSFVGKGLVLARATVLDGDKVVSKSDQPLTALAFEKAATKPNPAEGFGGTLVAGDHIGSHMIKTGQRIGLAWTRWYPHISWKDIQPEGPDKWKLPDELMQQLYDHGFSINAVLYSKPKWAFNKGRHLPKDMDWKDGDKRWLDLSIETNWDRYVKKMMSHYKDKSIAWEVVNEPIWDKWPADQYTNFCKRTYKLIKSIDPKAKVMLDGVYNFDWINQEYIKRGGHDMFDVYTWHNYSMREFTRYGDIKAMYATMKAAGRTRPVEVWFNEGWAHFPSSEDYPVPSLAVWRTPQLVAHDTVRAMAEAISGGQQKMIVFNMAYNKHGRSWYDWGTDGTSWFDDHDQPTVAIGVFNVLAHHLGLNNPVARIPLKQGMVNIFEDKRNKRGVAVIWSDKDQGQYTVKLKGLTRMDVMGNADALKASGDGTTIPTGEASRPWYVFADGISGKDLAKAFEPLKSEEISIASGSFKLPKDWITKGDQGNPYKVDDTPIWRFDRLWPPKSDDYNAYIRMDTFHPNHLKWIHTPHTQGGNPAAGIRNGVRITAMTTWKGGDKIKPSSLVFIAPKEARYRISTTINGKKWEGGGKLFMHFVKKDPKAKTATVLKKIDLPNGKDVPFTMQDVHLKPGEEFAFVFIADKGGYTGAGCQFKDLLIIAGSAERVDFSEETVRDQAK